VRLLSVEFYVGTGLRAMSEPMNSRISSSLQSLSTQSSNGYLNRVEESARLAQSRLVGKHSLICRVRFAR